MLQPYNGCSQEQTNKMAMKHKMKKKKEKDKGKELLFAAHTLPMYKSF